MNKTVLSLSFIVATRFFGLFIILPVFGLYAHELKGATTTLAGVAIGVYAIMQMIFQTPFGMASDKFGRKNTMTFGLVIFIIGSLVCAFADSIYLMILGRLLQGSGAVGAVAIAMISDFSKEEERGKAFAVMGMMIGLSFALSMILSPILAAKFGLSSLFHISGALTLLCIILLYTVVPNEQKVVSRSQKMSFIEIISHKDLTIMNFTNFMQKMLMTVAFFIIPIVLVRHFSWDKDSLWKIYSVAMIFGMLAMGFAGFVGEKKNKSKEIMLLGVVFFGISYVLFGVGELLFLLGVIIFFIGFCMHEPIMQSSASKFALWAQKGAVLGVFNSAGYFGTFLGGLVGGYFFEYFGLKILILLVVSTVIVWFFILSLLTNPAIFRNLYFNKELNFDLLNDVSGFIESYQQGSNFVVKYNSNIVSKEQIYEVLGLKDDEI